MKKDLEEEIKDLRNTQELLIKIIDNHRIMIDKMRDEIRPALLHCMWCMNNVRQEVDTFVKRR